ncbi:OLC1v1012215C1 [Oldenlandia corymbosa var. corymbosa]|uniref:OLC1v1012215C1 n=1 Tax=Oldenlandia corymbosa var. corymbosa TaxID=529605 RepID=A0AAV1DYM2_OLDCO|nr:OLC1v1012215C1 [Oldenlandia corymbosa var. corymbosa]
MARNNNLVGFTDSVMSLWYKIPQDSGAGRWRRNHSSSVAAASTSFFACATTSGSSADTGTAAAGFVTEMSPSSGTGAASTVSFATVPASSVVDASTTIVVGATSASRIIDAATSGKSYDSSSSDNDIKEIICDNCDNVSPANDNYVCELAQCLDAIFPKEAAADQQVAVSNDGFQDRRCNSSAELVNNATDSSPVKQKSNHTWLYDRRCSASRRSKRSKGKPIPHGFHFAKKVDDGPPLRGIDFHGANNNYAYLDYGVALEWRIDLAKDHELLKSLIGQEKKRSARPQLKILIPSVMRLSRIKAFHNLTGLCCNEISYYSMRI